MPQDQPSILIVDDEDVVRDSLFHWFESEEYKVEVATNASEALSKLGQKPFDVIIADIRMPGIDGLQLLERIRSEGLDTAVIIITGYASVDSAIRALKEGAFDYVTKPFDPDALSVSVRNAITQLKLKRENSNLRAQLRDVQHLQDLIGQSTAMRHVRDRVATAAGVDSTVLITGESGTGKELVARAIHALSNRSEGPWVVAHCGALADNLVESELFGHERGAFTGAQFRKKGKFEAAAGGTIFLDEVGDISLKTQTDLLRVLQEHEVIRVGSTAAIHVDFRVVAATNKDLAKMAREGLFRPDLYYRLNVFHIEVPPLRDRRDDIPLLAMHFIEKFNSRMNRKVEGLDGAALEKLAAYDWPGNVRELENAIERAMVVGRDPLIKAPDLAVSVATSVVPHAEDRSLAALEKSYIAQVLHECNWNQSQAARVLGIDRITLYHKIRRFGFVSPKARANAHATQAASRA